MSCWSLWWFIGIQAEKSVVSPLWYLLLPHKQVLQEDTFMPDPAQALWGPVSKVSAWCLQQQEFILHLWGQPRPSATVRNVLRVSWIILPNNSKEGFLSGVGILLDSRWFLEGVLSAQIGKFHLDYTGIWLTCEQAYAFCHEMALGHSFCM